MTITAFSQDYKTEISLKCQETKIGTYDIFLNYKPHSQKNQVAKLKINEEIQDLKLEASVNTSQFNRLIAQAVISKNDKNQMIVDISKKVEMEKNNRKTTNDSFKASYKTCYTFGRLASPECADYLDQLFSK